MGTEYTKNQINYQRSLGVSRAWERERALVRQGRGTRQWTLAEQGELLRTGRIKGYHGHHMKSVAKYPQYASDPKNIELLSARKGNNEHIKAHKGNYRNESNGRYNVRTGQIRPIKDGKPRAMYSYELKDKAIEKPGYEKYAIQKVSAKNSANRQTVFNGRTYQRALVKASPKQTSKASQKGTRYGGKLSVSSKQSKSSGNYGKSASSLLSAKGGKSGNYGSSLSGKGAGHSGNSGHGHGGGGHGSGGHGGGGHGSGGHGSGGHGGAR